jgi:hypothetical protein
MFNYCMADDFYKEFALQQRKHMIENKGHKHRNKPNRINDAEIMVVFILFHSDGFRCFKHYYKEYVCKHLTMLIFLMKPFEHISILLSCDKGKSTYKN